MSKENSHEPFRLFLVPEVRMYRTPREEYRRLLTLRLTDEVASATSDLLFVVQMSPVMPGQ